jgi:hypothetical protein
MMHARQNKAIGCLVHLMVSTQHHQPFLVELL